MSGVIDSPGGPYVRVPLEEWERVPRIASHLHTLAMSVAQEGDSLAEIIARIDKGDDQ